MIDNTSLTHKIQSMIDVEMANIGTSIPGYILEWTPPYAKVQIGIKSKDLLTKDEQPRAPIVNVIPVFAGGDFELQFEIKAGDECLIIFSQRCIEQWNQTGGVAVMGKDNVLSMTDAYCIVGLKSVKKRESVSYVNNGIRLFSKDNYYVWLKNDNSVEIKSTSLTANVENDTTITCKNLTANVTDNVDVTCKNITADASTNAEIKSPTIKLDGNVTITQNLQLDGKMDGAGGVTMENGSITVTNDVVANGISSTGHTHPGVQSGGSSTGGPQ